MIVLGIETAGPRGSAALLFPEAPPQEVEFPASRRLGADLGPTIMRLLKAHGFGPNRPPDLIAVDVGPGSYTGLRIGLAAAKALAFAWSRPLLGVSATDAISAEVLDREAPEHLLCALDASRGQVYASLYSHRGGHTRREREGGLYDPQALGATLPGATLVVGNAAATLVDEARGIVAAPAELAWPTATRIAHVGRRLYVDGARQDPLTLSPTYYRPNEAEEQRRKRSMRDGGKQR